MFNTALKSGGAIYFSCLAIIDNGICQLTIQKSLISNNHAKLEGGGLKWNYFEPTMKDINFKNNTAEVYGDDIASVAKYLIRINKEQIGSKYLRQISNEPENRTGMEKVQSGGKLSLYFGLIDKYETFVKTDSKSKLLIK